MLILRCSIATERYIKGHTYYLAIVRLNPHDRLSQATIKGVWGIYLSVTIRLHYVFCLRLRAVPLMPNYYCFILLVSSEAVKPHYPSPRLYTKFMANQHQRWEYSLDFYVKYSFARISESPSLSKIGFYLPASAYSLFRPARCTCGACDGSWFPSVGRSRLCCICHRA